MSNEEPTDLDIALAAADAGNAGHWPKVADVLADEYRKIKEDLNGSLVVAKAFIDFAAECKKYNINASQIHLDRAQEILNDSDDLDDGWRSIETLEEGVYVDLWSERYEEVISKGLKDKGRLHERIQWSPTELSRVNDHFNITHWRHSTPPPLLRNQTKNQ